MQFATIDKEAPNRNEGPKADGARSREILVDSTRDFHNARKSWSASLPLSDEIQKTRSLAQVPAANEDLDYKLNGKDGVFFNAGSVFYEMWRSNENRYDLLGHGRLLVHHPGAVISLMDDVQGICFGEAAMTKRLRVSFEVPFGSAFYETCVVRAIAEARKTSEDRTEIVTRSLMIDPAGRLIAWADAVFIQNAAMKQMQERYTSPELLKQARLQKWEKLAPLRLSGEHIDDPTMSFVLRIPSAIADVSLPVPASWASSPNVKARRVSSWLLHGRVLIDHCATTANMCRAVMQALKTSEGPVGNLHGGGAASACLDVLSMNENMERLRSLTLHYKRPIPLEVPCTIEWVKRGNDWDGVVRNFEGSVLQEVFAEMRPPRYSPSL